MPDKEVRLDVAGVTYTDRDDVIVSMSTHRKLFDGAPSVGNCVYGEIDLQIKADSSKIPRAAELRPYIRDTGNTSWNPKGRFYIATRSVDEETGTITILGYDDMAKTDEDFMQSGEQGTWPRTDINVVNEICKRIGVSLNAETRSILIKGYQIQYPGYGEGAYTMRDVLRFIGSMYAGNWFINSKVELKLSVLGDIPAETHYLIEEHGSAIVIGGVRILV